MSIFEEQDKLKETENNGDNSLPWLIRATEEKTTNVLELFKNKYFDEDKDDKKEMSLTPDDLRKEILNTINFIRDTKVKSLEEILIPKMEDESSKEKYLESKEKQHSLNIILSMFRHDSVNDLSALFSCVNILDKDDYDEKEIILQEVQKNIEGVEKTIKETDRAAQSIISGEILLYNVKQVAEDIKKVYNNLEIKIDCNPYDKCIIKTKSSLYSIIDNIVANAVRHGQATQVNVTIKKEKDDNDVLIEIENNGKQFPEGTEEDIFKKGFKGQETGNTGLGLALIRESIERDHGEIKAENTGQGVKFTIMLPLLEKK